MKLSDKGKKLIEMYKEMYNSGYKTADGDHVFPIYEKFNLKKFRTTIKPYLVNLNINTVLDYGSGGSNWDKSGFDRDSNQSAIEYFNLKEVLKYEPARNIDQRRKVDCVIVFDVLEHVYINDIKKILYDIFNYAEKIVVINVACYASLAVLPNGENAHVTVRYPLWWKGVLDTISMGYKDTKIFLLCSTSFNKAEGFKLWSGADWDNNDSFVTKLGINE